ncbi:MAG TPA: acetyl-CoA hydrolase/transferase C-terminal domain-containing protein [Spirochaetota bacterium]|nr:acetyl-CoA hydrolase/transferase C-terminal domain-containing protein [Spirochaetota bacterium]
MEKWNEIYKQKLMSADDAVKFIPQGAFLAVPLGNGQPPALINAMAGRMSSGELRGCEYLCAISSRIMEIHKPDVLSNINKYNTMDVMYNGPLDRYFVNSGLYSYVPHRLFDGPKMIEVANMKVAMITVSPMDDHGYFSTGINPDYIYGFINHSPGCRIIAEVNENMPRTFGNNHFHINELTAITENNVPLVELPEIPVNEKDSRIGEYIAELVPDGACLQLGIGSIPNAVAQHLCDKKELGVHSEMLCDSMVDLYEKGIITCSRKQFMPRKWLACFALGTKKLYNFVKENPLVEMHSCEVVNDPYNIGLNDNVISINSTLEVDLAGQCASESIGGNMYSGAGGQIDFIEGAWRSKGGKAILALYSTYEKKDTGELKSRIVPLLTSGAFVTTGRNDVQYIVTEYGVAQLKGLNMRNRVEALISVSHPDFRDWLRSEAKKLKYL